MTAGARVPSGLRARDVAILPADRARAGDRAEIHDGVAARLSFRLLPVSDSSLPAAVDGYLDRHRSSRRVSCRSPATRPIAAIFASCRRRASRSCWRSTRALRLRHAAVRQHGAAVQRNAGASAADSGSRRRSRRAGARGSRRRHAAGARRRGARSKTRGAVPPGRGVHRHVSAPRARAGRREVHPVRHRVRSREAHVGARLLHQALPRRLSRARARQPASGRRCGPPARRL